MYENTNMFFNHYYRVMHITDRDELISRITKNLKSAYDSQNLQQLHCDLPSARSFVSNYVHTQFSR
jgi:hypothetical protein